MNVSHRIDWRKRKVSLVPLIDVVFILLLFFMLTSNLMQEREIGIEFPGEGAAADVPVIQVIRLESDGGEISYNDRTFDTNTDSDMRALSAELGDAPVGIDTASRVSSQALITLLDRMALAGIENVSLMDGAE